MGFGDFLADHLGGTKSTGLTWDGNALPRGSRGLLGRAGSFATQHSSALIGVGRAGTAAAAAYFGGSALLPYFQRLQPGSGPSPLPGNQTYGPTSTSYCSLISDVRLRAACEAASMIFGGGSPGSGGLQGSTCPTGYHRGANGECVIDGPGSWLPGDVGRPDVIWSAVNGRYGAGLTPVMVQRHTLQCPAGFKLGKDNVCYESLSKKERKWNPGTKPFMTGGDLNAVARVKRLKTRGRKMASVLGLNSPSRRSCAPGKRRRK